MSPPNPPSLFPPRDRSLRAGERRRGGHPAADVAGESSPTGDGDRADGRGIRQHLSQVSARGKLMSGDVVFSQLRCS